MTGTPLPVLLTAGLVAPDGPFVWFDQTDGPGRGLRHLVEGCGTYPARRQVGTAEAAASVPASAWCGCARRDVWRYALYFDLAPVAEDGVRWLSGGVPPGTPRDRVGWCRHRLAQQPDPRRLSAHPRLADLVATTAGQLHRRAELTTRLPGYRRQMAADAVRVWSRLATSPPATDGVDPALVHTWPAPAAAAAPAGTGSGNSTAAAVADVGDQLAARQVWVLVANTDGAGRPLAPHPAYRYATWFDPANPALLRLPALFTTLAAERVTYLADGRHRPDTVAAAYGIAASVELVDDLAHALSVA